MSIYNSKYPLKLEPWKSLILRTYDERKLGKNRKILLSFLASLEKIKEGDVVNFKLKEDFSYYYIFKKSETLLISRFYWKDIENKKIMAFQAVSMAYLAKVNISTYPDLKEYYPFLPNLRGFLITSESDNWYNLGFEWGRYSEIRYIPLSTVFNVYTVKYKNGKNTHYFYISSKLE